MKIETITCHDVYNYGASLQAFALQHFLVSKGHDVKIIDYAPEYLDFNYKFSWFIHPSSKFKKISEKSKLFSFGYCFLRYLWFLRSIQRKKSFDEFATKYLHLTEKYNTYDSLCQRHNDADVYITGSDQVWNSVTMLNGLDPAFYLQFVKSTAKKISYAASFGANNINPHKTQEIISWLRDLTSISVRESSGVELLKQYEMLAEHVCDPVFLLTCEQWKNTLHIRETDEKYVLIYNLTSINEQLLNDALYVAKNKGLKIYSVSPMKIKEIDKNFSNVSPDKFVELIFNASYVFTNSFHATAFSIISNRQFYTYNYHSMGNSSRMESILKEMSLLSQFNIKKIKDAIKYPIDYKSKNELIERSRSYGRDWLLTNL